MKIHYFKPNGGHSIENVFIPIIKEINRTNYIVETEMPSNCAGLKDIIQNGMSARHQQKNGFINHITGADHFLLLFLFFSPFLKVGCRISPFALQKCPF